VQVIPKGAPQSGVRHSTIVAETFSYPQVFTTSFTQVLLAIEWRPFSIFVSEHQTKTTAPAVVPPLPSSPPYRPPPEPPLPDIYRPPSVPALSRNQVQRNPPPRDPAAASMHAQPLSDEALLSSAAKHKAVAIVQLRVIDADGLSTSRCVMVAKRRRRRPVYLPSRCPLSSPSQTSLYIYPSAEVATVLSVPLRSFCSTLRREDHLFRWSR